MLANFQFVVGNLVADPELRYTGNGTAVCNFTIASTKREYDQETETWSDGEPYFCKVTVWKYLAENVAASFTKGNRVIALGEKFQEQWTDDEGNKRTTEKMNAQNVGADLTFHTVDVKKPEKTEPKKKPARTTRKTASQRR